jgi:hypothetical protein
VLIKKIYVLLFFNWNNKEAVLEDSQKKGGGAAPRLAAY